MSKLSFDKAKIKSNFNRFATNYDLVADLQKQVADDLFQIAKTKINQSQNIIDLGCGSGFLADKILKECPINKNLFQLDLAFNMLENNKNLSKNIFNINADIENLPFVNKSFDLAISSLALQWVNDFEVALKEISSILRPQSFFIFSVFIDGTLKELKDSSQVLAKNLAVNEFIGLGELKKAIYSSGAVDFQIITKDFIREYQDIYQLLHSMKNVGASYSGAIKKDKILSKVLSKGDFTELNNFYLSNFGINGKIQATWKVAFVEIKF